MQSSNHSTNFSTPRDPNFDNLLAILRRETPERPTLFEFIIDADLLLPGVEPPAEQDRAARVAHVIRAYLENGYDAVTLPPWDLGVLNFPKGERTHGESISQNEGGLITDEASFEAYPWPNPDEGDFELIPQYAKLLPPGARFQVMSMGGVLENLTDLVGFEELCYMLVDEPELVQQIVDHIGSRLLRYYERCLEHESVGLAVVNDDWGHKTQTMLSPEHMRQYIIPWHKRIVELIHQAGRPAVLHSCGNLDAVWEDIIEDCRYDGKHSYEDAILPVEQALERYGNRIAILGGLDVDFLCRAEPPKIEERARSLVEHSLTQGGYALGTGNSIARYIPLPAVHALQRAAGVR